MKEENGIDERVIQSINQTFSDFSSIKKSHKFREQLLVDQAELEKKLDHANSSISHELQDLLNSGDELDRRVSSVSDHNQSIVDKARQCIEECGNFEHDNKEILKDIAIVRGVAQYTMWLQLIEQISLDISVSIETEDKDQIVNAYNRLVQVNSALKDSKCRNLSEYASATQKHWYQILTDKYIEKMQQSLKVFNYPFIVCIDNQATPVIDITKIGRDEVKNLQKSVEILLSIEIAPSARDMMNHLWLPMKVLIKPLRTRFKYHFLGTKATNNAMKPEWYFSQLSAWALSHRQFMNEYIQPAYDNVGLSHLAVLDFAKGLVLMATDKLKIDIPLVLEDDVIFAHTIDEIIGFSGDLSKTMQYYASSTEPSILESLTESNVFNRWLNMERKFAFEKVDSIFIESGPSVWESEVGGSFTPRAAEIFLALLLSVTERYKLVSSYNHRIQFLNMQTDLIEDFRVRLVQIVRGEKDSPLSSNLCPIINTIDHLITVLANWAETPFFLKLALEKTKGLKSNEVENASTGDDSDELMEVESEEKSWKLLQNKILGDDSENVADVEVTVFQTRIDELKYMKQQLINEVVESIYYTVTARSVNYRSKTKWFITDVGNINTLSPSACEMLQTLAFGLDSARKRINRESFQEVWRQLATRMHFFILEEVVLHNKFSLDGALQLEFDIFTGLFPIFGEFTKLPQSYFPDLMDVLLLLKLPCGTLSLTLPLLQEACHEGATNILRDLKIRNLNNDRAIQVIKCRIDVTNT